MSPTEVEDWVVYRGDSVDRYWPVFDPAGDPIASADDWTARVHVRAKPNGALLHSWDPAEVDVGADPDNPEVETVRVATPILPGDEFTWKTGVFDVEVTSPAGKVTTLYKGRIIIDPDTSHV